MSHLPRTALLGLLAFLGFPGVAAATCWPLAEAVCETSLCGDPGPWPAGVPPVARSACATAACAAGPLSSSDPRGVHVPHEDVGRLLRLGSDGASFPVPGAFDGKADGACRALDVALLPGSYSYNGLAFEVAGAPGSEAPIDWPPGLPFREDGVRLPREAPSGSVQLRVAHATLDALQEAAEAAGFRATWAAPRALDLARGRLRVHMALEAGGWSIAWSDANVPDAWWTGEAPCPPGAVLEGPQPAGDTLSARCVRDGVPDGPESAWTDAAVLTEGWWRQGERHGPWILTEDGLRRRGAYVDGREQGVWVAHHPDGWLAARETWEGGALHGPSERFEPYGTPTERGAWRAGQRDGAWTHYQGGAPWQEGSYRDGAKHGTWVERVPTGGLRSETAWCAGQPCGRERHWYDNGDVSLEGTWRAGQKHGAWRRYAFAGAHPSELARWRRGELHGRTVQWRPGEWGRPLLTARLRYRRGEAHGRWVFYGRYGQVERVEHYRHGEREGGRRASL